MTVDDVLDAINNNPRIDVRASASGDTVVLEDLTGSTEFNLTVADTGAGTLALDLGIRQSVSAGTLVGLDVNNVTVDTRLGLLNDGNGVRTGRGGSDLVFVDGSGELFTVSLGGRLSPSS